jgi:hypothetical protein
MSYLLAECPTGPSGDSSGRGDDLFPGRNFVVPVSPKRETAQGTVDGYKALSWTDDGVAFWALSDMRGAAVENVFQLFCATPFDQRMASVWPICLKTGSEPSTGDDAHENAILAHEMMIECRANMRGHKAGDGNADQAVN